MARPYSYHDSRARFSARLALRASRIGENMNPVIETALFKARAASDRASSHLEFVTMFAASGMTRLADQRYKEYESESHMASVYYAIAESLA